MMSDAFSPARWDHWLLLVSFFGVASYGLLLSWQWRKAQQKQRARDRWLRDGLSRKARSPLRTQTVKKSFHPRQTADRSYPVHSASSQQR